jgi:hypothetical protein
MSLPSTHFPQVYALLVFPTYVVALGNAVHFYLVYGAFKTGGVQPRIPYMVAWWLLQMALPHIYIWYTRRAASASRRAPAAAGPRMVPIAAPVEPGLGAAGAKPLPESSKLGLVATSGSCSGSCDARSAASCKPAGCMGGDTGAQPPTACAMQAPAGGELHQADMQQQQQLQHAGDFGKQPLLMRNGDVSMKEGAQPAQTKAGALGPLPVKPEHAPMVRHLEDGQHSCQTKTTAADRKACLHAVCMGAGGCEIVLPRSCTVRVAKQWVSAGSSSAQGSGQAMYVWMRYTSSSASLLVVHSCINRMGSLGMQSPAMMYKTATQVHTSMSTRPAIAAPAVQGSPQISAQLAGCGPSKQALQALHNAQRMAFRGSASTSYQSRLPQSQVGWGGGGQVVCSGTG